MSWQLAVLLKVLAGSVLAPYALRLLGDSGPRERLYRILLLYGIAAGIALVVALYSGAVSLTQMPWYIAGVGALMPLGVFFQWRVYVWSLSRGAIFMSLMNVLAILLSAVFLGEWQALTNWPLLLGFMLVVLGVGLHVRHDVLEQRANEHAVALPPAFYGNAVAFKCIFGVAVFLQNVWAKEGVSAPEFLYSWYSGAFVGALILFGFTRSLPKGRIVTISKIKTTLLIVLAGISTFLNLGLAFVSFQLVEQTLVLPIFALGDIVGLVLVGMFVFDERHTLRGISWLYFGLGFAGAVIIAVVR